LKENIRHDFVMINAPSDHDPFLVPALRSLVHAPGEREREFLKRWPVLRKFVEKPHVPALIEAVQAEPILYLEPRVQRQVIHLWRLGRDPEEWHRRGWPDREGKDGESTVPENAERARAFLGKLALAHACGLWPGYKIIPRQTKRQGRKSQLSLLDRHDLAREYVRLERALDSIESQDTGRQFAVKAYPSKGACEHAMVPLLQALHRGSMCWRCRERGAVAAPEPSESDRYDQPVEMPRFRELAEGEALQIARSATKKRRTNKEALILGLLAHREGWTPRQVKSRFVNLDRKRLIADYLAADF